MRWWCSAQGASWNWTWRPYAGVWLLLILCGVWYALAWRRETRRAKERSLAPPARGRMVVFASGVLVLWLALDWPIGALSGYLFSVHMLQFVLVSLVAPLLLLLGVPRAAFEALERRPRLLAGTRRLTHPLFALVLYNVILVFTHVPGVVDTLMRSQPGSFAIDALWMLGGLIFWWPVVCPVPPRPRFVDLAKMGYLFGNTVLAGIFGLILVLAEFPLYSVYELAPPIEGVPARMDQQLAGILMKLGGALVLWTAMTVIFFRWYRRDSMDTTTAGNGGQPGPRVADPPAAHRVEGTMTGHA